MVLTKMTITDSGSRGFTCYSADTTVEISSGETCHVGTQAVTANVNVLVLQIRIPV